MSAAAWSTMNKVGLVLQFVYGLANLPSAFMDPEMGSSEPGAEPIGPPMWVLWADTLLAVVLVVAVVAAWVKASQSSARLASASNVLLSLSGVPAYFVDGVPEAIKLIVTIGIVWTIVSVCLTHLKSKT